jgi:hypothetical protein
MGDETWCSAYDPKQSNRILNGLVRHPLGWRKGNSKGPHQDHVDKFFRLSRHSAVNAKFYEGVIDRLLKRIQQVCPGAVCSWDFFLLHDNVPDHKAAFANFLPPKMLQPCITLHTLQFYLRQTIFCSPSWKWN